MPAGAALALLVAAFTPVAAGGLPPRGPAPGLDPAPQASPIDTARADLRRRREALIRAYDLQAERPRLDLYARIITRAFRNPATARQMPIGRLPFVASSPIEVLLLKQTASPPPLGPELVPAAAGSGAAPAVGGRP